MNSLIVIGLAICATFVASVVALAQERNAPSFMRLLGAGCLIMVVLAHVAERFDFFPSMGWGLPESTGHYVDLVSAVAGLILLPAGYLSETREMTRSRL
jgi:O-antigen ligase